ncbi:MAG: extracellular solute-binding protein [Acetatifactor sp.]|nr:extracellular solute-binding protein [Acetatifactor sp.]
MKRNLGSRILSGMIALAVLALCSCSGADNGDAVSQSGGSYIYLPEYMKLDRLKELGVSFARFCGESLYYAGTESDSAGNFQDFIGEYSLADRAVVRKLVIAKEEPYGYVGGFHVTEEGSLAVLEFTYSEMESANSIPEMHPWLMAYDASGELLWNREVSDVFAGNTYISDMVMDAEDRVYIVLNTAVLLFDSEGSFCGQIDVIGRVRSAGVGNDGKVYVCHDERNAYESGYTLAEVDFDRCRLAASYQNYPGGNNSRPIAGSEYDFLVDDGISVYGYDLESQSAEELFQWMDGDIVGSYVKAMNLTEEGRLRIFMDDWMSGDCDVAYLVKTEVDEIPQKTTVVIATFADAWDLQAMAISFNRLSDAYRVVIRNYMDGIAVSNTMQSDALARLNSDLVSAGNCPDIIDLSQINVERMASQGVFLDLNVYLEQSGALGQEDYLENVLQAYTYDGVLTGIPTNFRLGTLVGKSAWLGEERGWTLKDLLDSAEAYPDAELFNNATRYSIMENCLIFSQDEFVNWNNNSCNFMLEDFYRLLELVSNYPERVSFYTAFQERPALPFRLADGDVLLGDVYLDDFQKIQEYEAMFGEPVNFIGLPTADGKVGCKMYTEGAFGITSRSEHAEGAWSFIEYNLEHYKDIHTNIGFSTRISELEKRAEECLGQEYLKDANGEFVTDQDGNPLVKNGTQSVSHGEWSYTCHVTTEDEVALVRELIAEATPHAYLDDHIWNIIWDEAGSFFAGQKTAKEVSELIQNRVQLYLDESQ